MTDHCHQVEIDVYGEGIAIEPPITFDELAPALETGRYTLTPSTALDPRGEGDIIRVGNLALHLLEGAARYIIGVPTDAATAADGIEEALGDLIAAFAAASDGTPRTFTGALMIDYSYRTTMPGPVRDGAPIVIAASGPPHRCEQLSVRDGRAVRKTRRAAMPA